MLKIIIADKSAVVKSVEREIIAKNSNYEVVGDFSSAEELSAKLPSIKADFILADFSIFKEERIEPALFAIKGWQLPVLLFVPKIFAGKPCSSNVTLCEKPDFIHLKASDIGLFAEKLQSLVLKTLHPDVSYAPPVKKSVPVGMEDGAPARRDFKGVFVGVSTGGPQTLLTLLQSMGKDFPLPVIITQHIDTQFDKNLIDWLNKNCQMPVSLVEKTLVPQKGHVYFAPADYHLVVIPSTTGPFAIALNQDEPMNFLRPAVDKMFDTAADLLGSSVLAVLLTGMGADGAEGCVRIKKNGGWTITQSAESCVIYGMPKAAYEAGGSCEVLPLEKIADRLRKLIQGNI